jgi:hypothetical protein
MQAVRQPPQFLQRSYELILRSGDLLPRALVGGRPPAAAQGPRQLPEPSLGPLVQATLQPPAFLVACL